MFVSEKDYEKKNNNIILCNIITNVARSTRQQEGKIELLFLSLRQKNNYVVRHNYALDGDNGMKNNMHNVFSKDGREGRISLKYKLFNEKAFCEFQLHQTKKYLCFHT